MSPTPSTPRAGRPAAWQSVLALLLGLGMLATLLWPCFVLPLHDLRDVIRALATGRNNELWGGGPAGWLLLAWLGLYVLAGLWLTAWGARGALRWFRQRD